MSPLPRQRARCEKPIPPAKGGREARACPRGPVGAGRDPHRPIVDLREWRTGGVTLLVRGSRRRKKGEGNHNTLPREGDLVAATMSPSPKRGGEPTGRDLK